MLPLIQREAAEKKKWISEDDILEITAIAESTPGPIAVNAATFVGFRTAGFGGAFVSTLGVILPSFLVISALSLVLREFRQIKTVQYAFTGIRAGVLALIIKAWLTLYKKAPKNLLSYTIAALAFAAVVFVKVNVFYIIIVCAVIGLIYTIIESKRTKEESK